MPMGVAPNPVKDGNVEVATVETAVLAPNKLGALVETVPAPPKENPGPDDVVTGAAVLVLSPKLSAEVLVVVVVLGNEKLA